MAPDILQFLPDGTGITADLLDDTDSDEPYITSIMLKNIQKIRWHIKMNAVQEPILSIAYKDSLCEYQLSFEYNIYPEYPRILCLFQDGGGGWIPVKAEDLY